MTAYTGSNESNPFDITPSDVSSGYFDEDDSISEGSYTAHANANGGNPASYHRTESNWSNSTLTNGRQSSQEVVGTTVIIYYGYMDLDIECIAGCIL